VRWTAANSGRNEILFVGISLMNQGECMDKRQRERARKEKQQQKEQRRVDRTAERPKRVEGGQDPDLEGIVPGPQPGQIVDLN
jgi:hypothetical protein